ERPAVQVGAFEPLVVADDAELVELQREEPERESERDHHAGDAAGAHSEASRNADNGGRRPSSQAANGTAAICTTTPSAATGATSAGGPASAASGAWRRGIVTARKPAAVTRHTSERRTTTARSGRSAATGRPSTRKCSGRSPAANSVRA